MNRGEGERNNGETKVGRGGGEPHQGKAPKKPESGRGERSRTMGLGKRSSLSDMASFFFFSFFLMMGFSHSNPHFGGENHILSSIKTDFYINDHF